MTRVPMLAIGAALLAGSVTAGGAQPLMAPIAPVMSIVPFKLETTGGQARPVVKATFNGHPFRMMVHSNANFIVQLKHGQARAFGIRDLHSLNQRYGIESAGKVSGLGRSSGIMDRVQVSNTVDHNVEIAVFEVPQDDFGMLGLGWIHRDRIILDYSMKQAILAPTPAFETAMRARLLKSGYSAIPMVSTGPAGEYQVQVTLGKVTRLMTVASASNTTFDPAFIAAAGIGSGARSGPGNGPTGTEVPEYELGKAAIVKLGRWTARKSVGTILDEYAYDGTPRPADPAKASGGALGSEFLRLNRAVVDFGNGVLYIR